MCKNLALIVVFLFHVLYFVEPSFIDLSVGLIGLCLKASTRVTLHLRFPVEVLITIGAVKECFHELCLGLDHNDTSASAWE